MNCIKIKFNKIEGILDLDTGYVYFYQFTYKNICTAVKSIEHDILSYKKELEIVDELIQTLLED